MRDSAGKMLLAGSKSISSNGSILFTEALVMQEGIRPALLLGASITSLKGTSGTFIVSLVIRNWICIVLQDLRFFIASGR